MQELRSDVNIAVANLEFFAGLATEMKGASVPMGPDALNFSVREPYGVVVRIAPFNHPLMFTAGKIGAPLAAGNSVIAKPPEQAPLSSLGAAELFHGFFPTACSTWSPAAGKWLPPRAALGRGHDRGDRKRADGPGHCPRRRQRSEAPAPRTGRQERARGARRCGSRHSRSSSRQGHELHLVRPSCGSTSRAFIHEGIHDAVLERVPHHAAQFRLGLPEDPGTTMGALISRQ